MKITIRHTKDTIDPTGLIPDKQFESVRNELELDYSEVLLAEYPDAVIEYEHTSSPIDVVITGISDNERDRILKNVMYMLSQVYEESGWWDGAEL